MRLVVLAVNCQVFCGVSQAFQLAVVKIDLLLDEGLGWEELTPEVAWLTGDSFNFFVLKGSILEYVGLLGDQVAIKRIFDVFWTVCDVAQPKGHIKHVAFGRLSDEGLPIR